MKETALIPTETLAFFVILAESEGVGIDKQRVCFVLAAELLLVHGMTWGMQRVLKDKASQQSSLRRHSFLKGTK